MIEFARMKLSVWNYFLFCIYMVKITIYPLSQEKMT